MKQKIIIDTDPGIDDALAIMLAVKSEKFEIQAITTVCGNSTIDNTTRNAQFILNTLGVKNIPLYSGAKKPLNQSLIKAVVHGATGLEGINPDNEYRLTSNAVNKILSCIKNNPKDITLITLGPLTNIALAIKKDPKTMSKVKEIVMMGGAVKAPGNKNRVAEFNIFVDPEAAAVVFAFPVKKTIIPLDVCNKVTLSLKDFQSISPSPLQKTILKMIRPYIKNIAKDEGVEAAFMYDPLTVYYVLNPNAARTYDCNIAIETKGILTRGMTVPDMRPKPDAANNVTVVDAINPKKFRKDFITLLSQENRL